MKIIRAEHLGMCFGVRDAIALALKTANEKPLTILGELVHNQTVLEALRQNGIQFESQLDRVPTRTAMITAHGASDRTISQARALGLEILEATCPLVHFAHRALRKLVEDGYHPVIIGKRDHVEVRGLTGDLAQFDVVLCEADIDNLEERTRFGVVAQTTQPVEKVRHLVRLIQQRFPNAKVRFSDTVCQPTKQRQSAAIELAQRSDAVVVIGGAHSNNTRELVATCQRHCPRVFHVQDAAELDPARFADACTVGLTAGTSTPDSVIASVEQRLREIAGALDNPAQAFDDDFSTADSVNSAIGQPN